jgi:pimeloyl-ACP methyl ester carboxylesterase
MAMSIHTLLTGTPHGLRGANSDRLRRPDAMAMTQRGPRATLVEFPGVGHAPALMAPDQIAAVRGFLLGGAG